MKLEIEPIDIDTEVEDSHIPPAQDVFESSPKKPIKVLRDPPDDISNDGFDMHCVMYNTSAPVDPGSSPWVGHRYVITDEGNGVFKIETEVTPLHVAPAEDFVPYKALRAPNTSYTRGKHYPLALRALSRLLVLNRVPLMWVAISKTRVEHLPIYCVLPYSTSLSGVYCAAANALTRELRVPREWIENK